MLYLSSLTAATKRVTENMQTNRIDSKTKQELQDKINAEKKKWGLENATIKVAGHSF